MKIERSKEWWMKMADKEGDSDVGAGAPSQAELATKFEELKRQAEEIVTKAPKPIEAGDYRKGESEEEHRARNAEREAIRSMSKARTFRSALLSSIPPEEIGRMALHLCASRNRDPDGQECRSVDGEMHCISFFDLAFRDVSIVVNALGDPDKIKEAYGQAMAKRSLATWVQ